jgi:hypothetical protein
MASERRTTQLNTQIEYQILPERRTTELNAGVEYQIPPERRITSLFVMVEIGYAQIVYGHAGPRVQVMT